MKKKGLQPLNRRNDRTLPSIRDAHNILVKRVLQTIEGKRVILLHIEQLPPHVPITNPLLQLVFGDPLQYEGLGFILEDDSEWSRIGQEPTPRFNCHAYSLGERVGLTAEDWLEGEPTNLSLDTNPTQILLSVYFRRRRTFDVAQAEVLTQNPGLREGDIISFTHERPNWGIVHEHSGRIRQVNGENWMASKFKTGRLLVTPIIDALQIYPDTRTIHVYRFRGN